MKKQLLSAAAVGAASAAAYLYAEQNTLEISRRSVYSDIAARLKCFVSPICTESSLEKIIGCLLKKPLSSLLI